MPQQIIEVPAPPGAPQVRIDVPGVEQPTPTQVYEAFRAQRRELRDQLESLEESREELSVQLQDPQVEGANKAGLEKRITEVDARISEVEQAIVASNARIAQAAAVPGAVVEEPQYVDNGVADEAVVMGIVLTALLLLPMTIAYTRRLWKKAGTAVMTLPGELYDRLTRLEQSVDSIAVEVERVGEGQRFMTRVLSEQREPQAVPLQAGEPAERG